jgi:hypothetical protein
LASLLERKDAVNTKKLFLSILLWFLPYLLCI